MNVLLEPLVIGTLHKHLFRGEIAQELVDILGIALGCQEFAGADVEKRYSDGAFGEVYGGEEVVFAVVEHIVVERHTRGNHLSDAALHELATLHGLGVFKLFADGHTLAGTHQSRQISVERMMGEACQGHMRCIAVGTLGECDAENFRRRDGIVAESLVEVAHTE